MTTSTYITIGIPFYNAESYLEEAICSILAQTHEYWELILIDDGSTDASLLVAHKYAETDKRIRVISDGKNKKLPYRLNQIIDESKYDYIARMDADDLMNSTRLEKQINYLQQKPDIDLVSTGIFSLKNDLTLVGYRNTSSEKIITKADAVIGTNGIIHASIMARKSWCKRNRYNETNLLAEDYELWLSAFINNDLKIGFLEEQLYYYREEQNIDLNKLLKAYKTQVKIIKKIPKKYITTLDKIKYIYKIEAKGIIVRGLFALNMDGILHSRRVKYQNIDKYNSILKHELKLIRAEKKYEKENSPHSIITSDI